MNMWKRDLILSWLILILIFAVMPASADVTFDAAEYGSLTDTMNAIPADAGAVTIRLSSGRFGAEEKALSIPADRGITALSLVPDAESVIVTGSLRLCAGGIPLTIAGGLSLPDASIYGGTCISGGESLLDSSDVTIAGAAGFVFGGSFAENGGSASVEEPSVNVTETGLVYYEVFGGGHAFGSGSRSAAGTTSVVFAGTSDYVLGGGFAEGGGTSEVTFAGMTVEENADVRVALFTGGSASGAGSHSVVINAKTTVSGYANWVFSGDFAFNGGQTELSEDSRLEILASGSSEHAFLGSFASDPGSLATVNTAELMNCGTVELITKGSQSSDGGEAKTRFPANFTCRE